MKRLFLILPVLILFALPVDAQVSSTITRRVRAGSSLPATCRATNPVDIFIRTGATNPGFYFCSATNTWAGPVATSSTSPGGSDTQVQFNDGSAFGGDAGLVYNKTTNALTIAGPIAATGVTGNIDSEARISVGISFLSLEGGETRWASDRSFGFSSSTVTFAGANDVAFSRLGPGQMGLGTGPVGNTAGSFKTAVYLTDTNCADGAGAAACGSASAGSVVIDAAATSVVVSTTAVTANSQIFVQEDSSLGARLGVTCNTTISRTYAVTARTAATSFTITTSAAPVTNPACLSYRIVN